MRDLIKKTKTLLKMSPSPAKAKRKTKAQSLVEFALLLPIILMLFTGMVEFGFVLNTYLSLLDATRQAARFYSNTTPFVLDEDTNTVTDDLTFYPTVAEAVIEDLAPNQDVRKIELDDTTDDVIVSVISVSVSESTNTITAITRYPTGNLYYREFGNQESEFTDGDIEALMTANGATPVRTGLLIVEVFYEYEDVLKLPYWDFFFPQPILLRASTVMPLVAAKPAAVP